MVNDDDLNHSAQLQAKQSEALDKDLYKLLDDIKEIVCACGVVSPDMFKQIVASVKQITKRCYSESADRWAKASDRTLRVCHNRRINTGKPIEPELEAELINRFPAYDAQTHRFTRSRTTDWTKTSDRALRDAYERRINIGKPIEPELETELIKRFPGYDAQNHKFTGRRSDLAKTTDASLRSMYAYRIKRKMLIEPELEAELIKRFPTYDAQTHRFISGTTDWTKSSDDSLRAVHAYRIKTEKTIEPELEAELIKRFPTYDVQSHRFISSTIDWTKSSDDSLRVCYNRRINAGKPIEPELEAELIKRFPAYDVQTHRFMHSCTTDWTKSSDVALYSCYYRRINAGKPIEPELEAKLIKRFPGYDAQTHRFATDRTKSSDGALYSCYYRRIKSGKPIEPELESELIKRFPGYDAQTHGFTTDWTKSSDDSLRVCYNRRINAGKPIEPELESELIKRFPAYDAQTHRFTTDWANISDSTLRSRYAYYIKIGSPIEPELEAELIKRFPGYDAQTHKFTGRKNISKQINAPVTKAEQNLIVNKRMTKMISGNAFYDVFLNGKRLLTNLINAKIELFLDGTVLGVYGSDNIQDVPSWRVYRVYNTGFKFQDVYLDDYSASNIRKINNDLIALENNNKTFVVLQREDAKRMFKIEIEKTR